MSSILVDLVANDMISGVVSNITGFATKAFSGLQGQLMESIKLQTSFLANSGSLSAVTGMSFENAKGFTKDLNVELAKVAAELPGVTKDYQSFAQSIQGVIAKNYDLSDQLGVKTFKTDLIELSKRAVLLGQASGTQAQDTAYYMKQFLSVGNTLASLNPLSFDDRNPAFVMKVNERLTQIGKTTQDFKKMSSAQRQRILETVLKQLTPDQMINEIKNTADSILQAWKDNLTNQDIGTFGFMRAVRSRGDRTAMDAFTDLLSRIDSMGNTANKLLSKLGLTFDPMTVVIDFFDLIGSWVTGFEATLEDFNGTSPTDLVGHLIGSVGSYFAGLGDFIRTFDPSKVANQLGASVTGLINSVDWASFGSNMGSFFGTVAMQGAIFLAEVIFDPALWLAVIMAVTKFGTSFFMGLLGGVFQVATNDLGRGMKGLGSGFNRDLSNLFKWVSDKWSDVKSLVDPVLDRIKSVLQRIGEIFEDGYNRVRGFIEKLNPFSGGVSAPEAVSKLVPEPVKDAVAAGIDKLRSIIPGQQPGEAPASASSSPTTANPSVLPLAQPSGSQPLPAPATVSNNNSTVQQTAFNPVININGANAANPTELVNMVISAFRTEYDRTLTQQLT
jgi:hypothetical protein